MPYSQSGTKSAKILVTERSHFVYTARFNTGKILRPKKFFPVDASIASSRLELSIHFMLDTVLSRKTKIRR